MSRKVFAFTLGAGLLFASAAFADITTATINYLYDRIQTRNAVIGSWESKVAPADSTKTRMTNLIQYLNGRIASETDSVKLAYFQEWLNHYTTRLGVYTYRSDYYHDKIAAAEDRNDRDLTYCADRGYTGCVVSPH